MQMNCSVIFSHDKLRKWLHIIVTALFLTVFIKTKQLTNFKSSSEVCSTHIRILTHSLRNTGLDADGNRLCN